MSKIKYIKTTDYKAGEWLDLKSIIRALGYGIAVVGILLMLSAIVFTYSNAGARYISIVAKIIFYFGAIIVGFFSALKVKSNGWLVGGISGAIYVAVLTIINLLQGSYNIFDISTLITIIVAVIFGAFGGILGINFKFKK